jgi:hypothetical protein
MASSLTTGSVDGSDPLEDWRHQPSIRPVLPAADGHTLHTYFGVSPESPDERHVLLFSSHRLDAQLGQLLRVERATGQSTVLDAALEVEDGHRQANQQWVCGGRYIVYMALHQDEWTIVRVDTRDLSKTILATGRQLGWGQPHLDVVPLYGLHWNPGQHRDLELLDVRTGEIRTALTADQVVQAHRDFVQATFGGGEQVVSLFFPTLSPDGRRIFFKLASPRSGLLRSPDASLREGKFVYDLGDGHSIGWRPTWGHPAWHPDSRHIQDLQVVFDPETMTERQVLHFSRFGGAHPSVRSDGRVLVSDVRNKEYLPQPDHWTVLLADLSDGHYHILHVAPVSGDGTQSWRPVHPHPAFNARGNRIYFNVPTGPWTVLHVAELPQ